MSFSIQCDPLTWMRSSVLFLYDRCWDFASRLFLIFERCVSTFPSNPTLTHRTITVGGVENTGNSCIFAAILQDFAALPHVYDPLLLSPLKKSSDETELRFVTRQAMQQCLRHCIGKIRSGNLVEDAEVRNLAEHLQHLGWQGHLSSAWHCCLSRLAPGLFPVSHFGVYDLYEKTLKYLLPQNPQFLGKIVLAGKEDTRSFSEFFASHPELQKGNLQKLWRIALNQPPATLEEHLVVGSRAFSLQVVHAFRTTPLGKHVVVYRKVEGEWICCDDTQITRAAPAASDHIYTVVYESRPL